MLPGSPSIPTHRAHWAEAAHRLGLPAAGGAVVGVGAALAAGVRGPLGNLAAAALMAAGAAALGASAVAHWAQRRSEPESGGVLPGGSGARTPADGALEGIRTAAREFDPFPPAPELYFASQHGAAGPIFSVSTSPGDQLWSSWKRADADHLLAPLVGPVPETVFLSPKPGETDPFADRAPAFSVDPELRLRARPPSGPLPGPGPYPEEVLDRWFPPGDSDRPPASVVEAIPDDPRSELVEDPYSVFGAPPEPGSSYFEVHFEAVNPTPPHLRAPSGDRTGTRSLPAGRPRSRTASFGASVCTSCGREVPDLRSWGPCPECLRPVCSHCLLQALWTHGQGICSDCAAARPGEVGFALDGASIERLALPTASPD